MSKTTWALVCTITILIAALSYTIGKNQKSAFESGGVPSRGPTLEGNNSQAGDSITGTSHSPVPVAGDLQTERGGSGDDGSQVQVSTLQAPTSSRASSKREIVQNASVYRGAIKYPDFRGRDKAYAYLRTRITDEMRTGPNFFGKYSIIQLGCGTGCSIVLTTDLETGRVYDFPYGGEDNSMLDLKYGIKSNSLVAKFVQVDLEGDEEAICIVDEMYWNGNSFVSLNKRSIGNRSRCEQ